MFKFFRYIWNIFWKTLSILRNTFFNLIFLVIVVVIIASIAESPVIEVPNKTALYVAPQGFLVDQSSYTPDAANLFMDSSTRIKETPLHELIDTINKAATDNRITALILHLDGFLGGGISKIEELGQAIENFRAHNKPIYAYSDNYSQQQYFLASYADTVYMNTMGNVLLTGFGTYRNYFKDAAEKLSVKLHVFRVGDYKDAVEPFMRNSMSEASKEHNSRWLKELWQRYVTRIAQNRELEPADIDRYIRSLSIPPAIHDESLSELALQTGLVDELLTRDGINDALAEKVGSKKDSEDYKAISYQDYARATKPALPPQHKNTIGLIVASGNIIDGHHDKRKIGGDSLADLIKQAREDDSLKALVIRIDSGGGSAFASEVIRQQIIATREAGLPVYISMGSIAASGGYWVATAADEVWATASTITGSIGVFGLIPNVSKSFERMGIYSDGIGTTKLSDIYQIDREMSQAAENLIQNGVNDIYARFLNIVAEARKSDPASVNEIAGGRVWTGEKAKTLGLVDHLGSLDDVFKSVANTKSLGDYVVKVIEKPLTPTQEIMRALSKEVSVQVRHQLLSDSSTLQTIEHINQISNGGRGLSHHIESLLTAASDTASEGQPAKVMAICMDCYSP